MNSAIASLLNGASAIAVGGYIAAVIYQGNADEFIKEAVSDYGYIEFLLAIVAIKVMLDIPYVGDAVFWFVLMAIVAFLLKVASKADTASALDDFGNGEAGLFQTIIRVFQ